MDIVVREYTAQDLPGMMAIWNEIVQDGIAFPQTERLSEEEAIALFLEQSFTAVAENRDTGEILGLYLLHPNNVGRCGHIANASYGVISHARGLKIGEKLVVHSIEKSRELGFRLIQFNAVVRTNLSALHLYEKLGFVRLGTIPGGFLMKDGYFEDIVLFYFVL